MPRFRCTSCNAEYEWTPQLAGREIRCPSCGSMMKVPTPVRPKPVRVPKNPLAKPRPIARRPPPTARPAPLPVSRPDEQAPVPVPLRHVKTSVLRPGKTTAPYAIEPTTSTNPFAAPVVDLAPRKRTKRRSPKRWTGGIWEIPGIVFLLTLAFWAPFGITSLVLLPSTAIPAIAIGVFILFASAVLYFVELGMMFRAIGPKAFLPVLIGFLGGLLGAIQKSAGIESFALQLLGGAIGLAAMVAYLFLVVESWSGIFVAFQLRWATVLALFCLCVTCFVYAAVARPEYLPVDGWGAQEGWMEEPEPIEPVQEDW